MIRVVVWLVLAVVSIVPTSLTRAQSASAAAWISRDSMVRSEGRPATTSRQRDKDARADAAIVTDRPDFTESSSTVGKGRLQIEGGYTYSRNREAGIRSAQAFPELLLRVGVFADQIELRVAQSFSRTSASSIEGDILDYQGADDIYFGVKLGIASQRRSRPELALVLQSTAPTGDVSLSAGRMLPGVNLLYGWDLGSGAFSVAGSSQVNGAAGDSDRLYAEFAQSATLGWDFTEKFGAYAETYAFFPHGSAAVGTPRTAYVNGGFRFQPTRNVQWDVRVGRGLTEASDDYFVGVGVSVRR